MTRSANTRWINRLSIRQKLVLLICTLLLSTIFIYGLSSYYALKDAALSVGKDRLATLTKEIGASLSKNAAALLKTDEAVAEQNVVIQYLQSQGKTRRSETMKALNSLHKDSTTISIDLLDKDLKTVLHAENSTGTIDIDPRKMKSLSNAIPGAGKVGRFYVIKGNMYYPAINAVSDGKNIIGYVVLWKILRTDPKAMAQMSRFVGTGAGFCVANFDGTFWTNFVKPIQPRPYNLNNTGNVQEFKNGDGARAFAYVQPVDRTAWVIVIEFSEQNILGVFGNFVTLMLIIGIVLTAIGIITAWITARNLTRPLNQLTAAAMAISSGDYLSRIPVEVNRDDELGKLARAFNIMEQYVTQTYEELEAMVEERTEALSEEIKLRQMSEDYLRESRQRYHLMIDEVKDYAIIMLDAEGKILVWNQGAERIKGYKEEEILGKSFSLFYIADDIRNNKPQKMLEKAVKEGRAEDEGWRVRKDGSKFWADVVLTSIYNEGKLVGFAKITRDITERKRLQDEVALRTSQMEKANKELEAFSYSVSHDLRTPLRAVSGYSIMLKEDYEDKLDSEGNRILGNIVANARMMGQLIDDLLAFARLGKKELINSIIDMQLLTTRVVNELLQHEDKDYDIRIGILPPVEGDSGMLKQVLMNLVSNAIKYSSKKERPIIEIGATDEETRIIYYVKDNGVGFDMAYAGKLFGVFQRLHSQEEFEGTGVGLALVKRIMDKHKGEVWGEGVEDSGAVFYFSLPKNNRL
ncbi:MAG TPA: PAS domain S-box protein [Mucilaginibacter sp.]|nr:PAS domain S-box protein [Mucilaginibacter sp.]